MCRYSPTRLSRRRAGEAAFAPTAAQRAAAVDYARRAKKSFGRLKEEAVRPILFSVVLETLLGYKTADPESVYSLAFERPIRSGSVDVALGRFDETAGRQRNSRPVRPKGPTTARSRRADARARPQPRSAGLGLCRRLGRALGAGLQLPGNPALRLRARAESLRNFDLGRLDEPEEHARLFLMLPARSLLGARSANCCARPTAPTGTSPTSFTAI